MSDQEQLSTEQERAYVEAAWVRVEIDDDPLYGTRIDIYTGLFADYTGHAEVSDGLVVTKHIFRSLSPVKAVHAAFLFTKEHGRKIDEVRQEIDEAVPWSLSVYAIQDERKIRKRTVARLEAALADLLRGWREKGDGNGRG